MKAAARKIVMLLVVLAAAASAEAAGRELSGDYPYVFIGPAEAVDGETLSIHGQVIRLQDIAAPGPAARCLDIHGRPWSCGEESRSRLAALVDGGKVACYGKKMGADGSVQAICYSYRHSRKGETLNERMVADGWAKPDGAYGEAAYHPRRTRQGIWSGRQLPPGDTAPLKPRQGLGLDRRYLVPGGAAL